MLGDETDLKNFILKTEGINYDENIFMPVNNMLEIVEGKEQTVSYSFIHNPTGKLLVIPFDFKADFTTFLQTGDISDLPRGQKLI